MMKSLALLVRNLQGNLDVPPITSLLQSQLANTLSKSQIHTDYRGDNNDKTRLEQATRCMYCGKQIFILSDIARCFKTI